MLIYPYLVPLTGIGFVFALIRVFRNKYLYTLLASLGIFTLDIYVSHIYFLRFAFGQSSLTKIISGMIISIVLSLSLSILILRRSKILNIIFLGGRPIVPLSPILNYGKGLAEYTRPNRYLKEWLTRALVFKYFI